MEVRAARPSEREQVLDLLALWFGDREFFALYNRADPKFRDDLCLVAVDAGRIVSTVQIFDRVVNLAGQRVPMGGIGSVFTLEEYRHKGVASALMRLSIETMIREGFEISLLFAERLTFYNQFGWREIDRTFSMLPGTESLRVPAHADATIEINEFDPARDLPAVAKLHRDYSGRFDVSVVRDDTDWLASLAFAGNQANSPGAGSLEYFILARERGELRAYARVTPFHGVTMLMEYGYAGGADHALLALLRHVGELLADKSPTSRLVGRHRNAKVLGRPGPQASMLISHTAHDPNLEKSLAAAGLAPTHHGNNNYMWRVLTPEKLAHRLDVAPAEAERRAFEIFAHPRSLYWTADRF